MGRIGYDRPWKTAIFSLVNQTRGRWRIYPEVVVDVVTGARVNLSGVYNVYNGGELLRWREKKGRRDVRNRYAT